jgi:hypothetical protein
VVAQQMSRAISTRRHRRVRVGPCSLSSRSRADKGTAARNTNGRTYCLPTGSPTASPILVPMRCGIVSGAGLAERTR